MSVKIELYIRKGLIFWQGKYVRKTCDGSFGTGNRHIYRALTRSGIKARMFRVRRRNLPNPASEWERVA